MKPSYALAMAGILSSAMVFAQEATGQAPQPSQSSSSLIIAASTSQAPAVSSSPSSTLSTSYVSSSIDSSAAAAASSSFYAPVPTQTTSQVDSADGGAGVASGAFQLGTGGLIAICVIIGVVVLFGIVTTALFLTAKKRQWEVRKSIARFSRRVVGRRQAADARPPPSSSSESESERPSKRQAIIHGPVSMVAPPSYRRSQRDMEKAAKLKAEAIQMGRR